MERAHSTLKLRAESSTGPLPRRKELTATSTRHKGLLHNVTFEELDQVSPLLASRGGLSTAEDSLRDIAVKIAELVTTLDGEEVDELSTKTS